MREAIMRILQSRGYKLTASGHGERSVAAKRGKDNLGLIFLIPPSGFLTVHAWWEQPTNRVELPEVPFFGKATTKVSPDEKRVEEFVDTFLHLRKPVFERPAAK